MSVCPLPVHSFVIALLSMTIPISIGGYHLTYFDEFIDQLLTEERVCDVILPRLTRRDTLEETEGLAPRTSLLVSLSTFSLPITASELTTLSISRSLRKKHFTRTEDPVHPPQHGISAAPSPPTANPTHPTVPVPAPSLPTGWTNSSPPVPPAKRMRARAMGIGVAVRASVQIGSLSRAGGWTRGRMMCRVFGVGVGAFRQIELSEGGVVWGRYPAYTKIDLFSSAETLPT
jgi:hypothetical protein